MTWDSMFRRDNTGVCAIMGSWDFLGLYYATFGLFRHRRAILDADCRMDGIHAVFLGPCRKWPRVPMPWTWEYAFLPFRPPNFPCSLDSRSGHGRARAKTSTQRVLAVCAAAKPRGGKMCLLPACVEVMKPWTEGNWQLVLGSRHPSVPSRPWLARPSQLHERHAYTWDLWGKT